MGWQDRDYNASRYGGAGHPILAILNGSVPLGTWFGIRVRIHASLILFILLTLIFQGYQGYSWHARIQSMVVLFGIVLLHEFGHCFAARSVGGMADEILMWPLGGLAFTQPPQRPWPTFVTVAGGPLVNVAICLITAALLWFGVGYGVSLNPFAPVSGWHLGSGAWSWGLWTFVMSYYLLLFNLLPIYPLDGGRILQTALWPKMGYFRSTLFSTNVGMVGAVILGIYGIFHLEFLLLGLAICGFYYCWQQKMMLREMGPESWAVENEMDFSQSLKPEKKRRHLSRRAIRKAQKLAAQEQAEQARIDEILAKVSAHGMQSLTWWERRSLKKATEHQRQRDLELARRQD